MHKGKAHAEKPIPEVSITLNFTIMKQIGKLKLNQLSKAELNEREMNFIKGGSCSCGCHYAGSGGSSSCENSQANLDYSYTSYGGGKTCSPCSSNGTVSDQAFFMGC